MADIRYNHRLATLGQADAKTLSIEIGPIAFDSRALLYSTIDHELFHVQKQFIGGDVRPDRRHTRELQAYQFILDNHEKYGFSEAELAAEVRKRNYYYFQVFGVPFNGGGVL